MPETAPLIACDGLFPVQVNYKASFAEMVRASKHTRLSEMVTEEHFPITPGPADPVLSVHRQVAAETTSIEVIAQLDRQGFRPARPAELLAFGATHTDTVLKYGLTLALGGLWPYKGYQTCLSYWVKPDKCVLLPSYCGAEGTTVIDRYGSIAYLAAPTETPEQMRAHTVGIAWFEWCERAFLVRRLNKAFAPKLPCFVGMNSGALLISDEMPKQFHKFALIHEIECNARLGKAGRCLEATAEEIAMVPPPWREEYVTLRIGFYDALMKTGFVNEELRGEIKASLEYLRQLNP